MILDRSKSTNLSSASYFFLNRLWICTFSICLLWLSSLEVAVNVVEHYVVVPQFSDVLQSCQYAYNLVVIEQNHYSTCVHLQSAHCRTAFDATFQYQLDLMKYSESFNNKVVNMHKTTQLNCSHSVTQSKYSINMWSSQSIQNSIPYTTNCSTARITEAKLLLSDSSSSRKSIYSSVADYVTTSESAVSSMATYSEALGKYNIAYAKNNSKQLQRLAMSTVSSVSLPYVRAINVSLQPIEGAFTDIVSCVSLADTSSLGNHQCSYGVSLHQLYSTLQSDMNVQLAIVNNTMQALQSELISYYLMVQRALAAADSFYNSVVGVTGVVAWILQQVSTFTSASSLCGKGSPDWCQFSTVRELD